MLKTTAANRLRTWVFALLVLVCMTGTSSAAVYWLRADTITKTMPDSQVITMWGFAQCTAGFASCSPATVPGPTLTVPPGDTTLTINLRNNLTGPYVEPVSLIIPGQSTSMTPVWINTAGTVTATGSRPAGDVTSRARSLTHETAPGATGVYTWPNVKAGTYLYQSATHQSLQVQMGLYGAAIKNVAAGQAYTGVTFAREAVLLLSEIDPAVHSHVASGTYGTPPPTGITSTIDFKPKYFMVNGAPYTAGTPAIPAGKVGSNTLLRLLNAGLRDYVPLLQGAHMSIVAEDGNALPFPKSQTAMILPAGKTMDAIMVPPAGTEGTSLAIYDRRLNLTNNLLADGGIFRYLSVVAATGTSVGLYNPATSTFYLRSTNDAGIADLIFAYGLAGAGWVPLAGNWDGAGGDSIGLYNPVTGTFYLRNSNTTGVADVTPFVYGLTNSTWIPLVGNWDGAGGDSIGLYNPVTGTFYLRNSNTTGVADVTPFVYGPTSSTWIPLVGNWDGAGDDSIGLYNPVTGTFYLRNSNTTGIADITPFVYGPTNSTWKPVVGDWDGDGIDTIGLFDPTTSTFYLRNSNTTGVADVIFLYGLAGGGWLPVVGDWN